MHKYLLHATIEGTNKKGLKKYPLNSKQMYKDHMPNRIRQKTLNSYYFLL